MPSSPPTLAWATLVVAGLLAGCADSTEPIGSSEQAPQTDTRPAAQPAERLDANTRSARAPLGELTPSTPRLEGEVVELLPAGGYTYFRLSTDERNQWVVILGDAPTLGQRVVVTNMGERQGFHSARLDRDFDNLAFGALEVG